MKKTINCKGKIIDLSKPIVMGILNITSDSFFDGNKYTKPETIAQRAENILSEGATIIDIGACSTRPGAVQISPREELRKLSEALEIINKKFPDTIISVDTYNSSVAKKVVENYNVAIINDISAGNIDPKMLETIALLGVPYVLMHMKGTPQTMQNNPQYNNILKEMTLFFSEKINFAAKLGINDIIIDPGFGFGKTIEHNYLLFNQLDKFKIFDLPVLIGISRKSMIYKPLNISADDSLPSTIALNAIALQKGVNILRVHDVKEAVQLIKINSLLQENQ